jgi:hypothetical protein
MCDFVKQASEENEKLVDEMIQHNQRIKKLDRLIEVEQEDTEDIEAVLEKDTYLNQLKTNKTINARNIDYNVERIQRMYEIRIQRHLDEIEKLKLDMEHKIHNERNKDKSSYFDDEMKRQIEKLTTAKESKRLRGLRCEKRQALQEIERLKERIEKNIKIMQTPVRSDS